MNSTFPFSHELLTRLRQAEDVCVLTGAGISAESGVPTFRGSEGLWKKFRPEELANLDAFLKNPSLVWEWYTYRKKLIHEVEPNAAHRALAELEKRYPHFALVTQNVDNLHARAGSRNILELHGNIERSFCIQCRKPAQHTTVDETRQVPHCESCGGLVRPDVVWFGEMLPAQVFEKAQAVAESCQVFLCIGTSGVVHPAAFLPLIARREGAYVAEFNAERTELSASAHETILGQAGETLPQLLSML